MILEEFYLSESIKFMERCCGCGLCQKVCPVYQITYREALGPAGKIAVLKHWQQIPEAEIANVLQACIQCGQCEQACPASLPLLRIFAMANQKLPKKLQQKRAFCQQFALDYPRLLDLAQPALAFLQTGLTHGKTYLAPKAFRLKKETGDSTKKRVLLFTGCISRRILPEIALACVEALVKNGFEVVMPPQLTCCGANAQDKAEFAKKNLQILAKQKFDFLCAPCSNCLKAIKSLWPKTRGLNPELVEFAKKLGSRSHDINVFLAKFISTEDKLANAVWFSSCKMTEVEQNAAKSIAGIRESQTVDQCCGGLNAAFFNKEDEARGEAQIKRRLAQNLRASVMATGCRRVVAACPGCILSLKKALKSDQVDVLHPLQIYAKSKMKFG